MINLDEISPETLRLAAKVFQIASILDDRVAQPDKARIAAWGAQLQRHKFNQSDLLDGLQAFYDSPSERAIQIGDLIHHAKIVRRDRTEREEADEQRRRLENRDQAAVDDLCAVSVAFTGPTKNRTDRLVKAELGLQCAEGKRQVVEAMREWTAAKTAARKGGPDAA